MMSKTEDKGLIGQALEDTAQVVAKTEAQAEYMRHCERFMKALAEFAHTSPMHCIASPHDGTGREPLPVVIYLGQQLTQRRHMMNFAVLLRAALLSQDEDAKRAVTEVMATLAADYADRMVTPTAPRPKPTGPLD